MAADDIDDATGYAGHGIDFLAEDERHLVDEDVTDDTTRSPRDAAHDDGRPPGKAQLERLLNTDDVEKSQTDGVEKEDCSGKPVDLLMKTHE